MNQRMVKLALMLSSTSDREVVSAARAIGRMLKERDLDWHDLGKFLGTWSGIKEATGPTRDVPPPPKAKPERDSWTLRPGDKGWNRRAAPETVDKDVVQAQVIDLMRQVHRMQRKNRDFIEGLDAKFDQYGERTFISEPQARWVASLHNEYVRTR